MQDQRCLWMAVQSPGILTSDDLVRCNEIVRTKWLIFLKVSYFVNNPPGFILIKIFWGWVVLEVKGLLEVNVRESIKGVYLNKNYLPQGIIKGRVYMR